MRFVFVVFCLWLPGFSGWAQGFDTIAPVAIIMDAETGTVLYEKGAREPIPPASMTKIMTLYMVFERLQSGALSLDDKFTISDDAWRRGGFRSGSSTMCLRPNERVRVEDLIRGVVVLSGNDAAIALAENIGGSEAMFAKTMTNRAHELGLNSVNFVNATGWPADGHEISAYDLAKLAKMTVDNFPDYYTYYAQKEYDWCKVAPSNRFNRNPLLALFAGADGLKTGHTTKAGYGLVASAVRDGQRRIIVLSGLKSKRDRVRLSERIMRAAFSEFEVKSLFDPARAVGKVKIHLGKQKQVAVHTKQPVSIGIFKPDASKISAKIIYSGAVPAPITLGQNIATLRISVPGQADRDVELLASETVARQGFFKRALSGLVLLIQGPPGE
ncbi:D-alanyl-D-alanine carboxypeptidase [hydrothermal vent metagenome]|uniref:serine-type D-Ala-D-Ala carboxypeptidase n=1 Tax=hydrothermal vent metagenome TaxID=652676 RepID=A0A3B0RI02_9ZZZZ